MALVISSASAHWLNFFIVCCRRETEWDDDRFIKNYEIDEEQKHIFIYNEFYNI